MRVVLLFIFFSHMCYGAEKILAPLFFEYHIIDTSRQELYPQNQPHSFRECMMHVWVPHDEQQKQYPLILFSHGLGDTYNGMTYTYLCRTIASCGYVVASVSHTYGCKAIQFPDGRIADYNFYNRAMHYGHGGNLFDQEVEIWVDDMICALNECQKLNTSENEYLYNKIDMSRVGMIGHSLGGSTAIQMCRRDSRVAAAINLDGPLYGTDAMKPFSKPMLFIFGSSVLPSQITALGKVPMHYAFNWRSCFNMLWLPSLDTFIALLSSDVHKIVIEGIVHDTFTDYAFTPDPEIQQWLIDGAVAHCAIVGYVCEFLDRYLKS
jgi:predicted esterase